MFKIFRTHLYNQLFEIMYQYQSSEFVIHTKYLEK